MKKTLLFAIIFSGCSQIFSQNKLAAPVLQSGIRVIVRAYGDSIVLRWAPQQAWAWHKLNMIGYKIERIDVSEKDNPRRQWLTTAALKPWPLEKFKVSFASDNNNAAIAAQCLYGKNFNTNLRPGQAGIEDKANVSSARYAYVLMAADYDAGVGMATALRFADKNVKKGGTYIYRVVPASMATQGKIDTGTVMITNIMAATAGKPEITEALASDGLSELHWSRAGANAWSGFYIERSEDGKNFQPLNTLPYTSSLPDSAMIKEDSNRVKLYGALQTQHIYIDSLPQNYKNYAYRIKGIDAFAELSAYSNTVVVSGRDQTPPVAPNILNPTYTGGRKMKVSWQKTVTEKDCKGFYITRSRHFEGPYVTINQQLLPPSAKEYTDDSAFAHGGSFYVIVAVDTANNISASSPAMGLVPDNTAPATPRGLKGRIDQKGLVYLSWEGNSEEDIKGYKIYYANASDHVFTQLTAEADSLNSFVDSITLKTLTKNIWYKIAAVDYNNNHSDFSTAVQLKKPDIIPPTAPIAKNVIITDKQIDMDWIQSSSDDAVGYIIYRRQGNEKVIAGRYKHIAGKESFHFTDSTSLPNLVYNYTAEAIDEDSLHSPSSIPVNARISAMKERPAIKTLTATYDAKTKLVQLQWQYDGAGDYFFILYRGNGIEPLQRHRSVNKEEKSFTDHKIEPGINYSYAIQAIYRDSNGDSKMSEPVKVVIK